MLLPSKGQTLKSAPYVQIPKVRETVTISTESHLLYFHLPETPAGGPRENFPDGAASAAAGSCGKGFGKAEEASLGTSLRECVGGGRRGGRFVPRKRKEGGNDLLLKGSTSNVPRKLMEN